MSDPQLFDSVPRDTVPRPRPACGATGPWEAYAVGKGPWGKGRPRCNRMPGHDGPHRVYTKAAEIKAEWTVSVQVKQRRK